MQLYTKNQTIWKEYTNEHGKTGKEKENKTIRFPLYLVERIEKAISTSNQEVTFSSFVIQACEYALDNLEEQ